MDMGRSQPRAVALAIVPPRPLARPEHSHLLTVIDFVKARMRRVGREVILDPGQVSTNILLYRNPSRAAVERDERTKGGERNNSLLLVPSRHLTSPSFERLFDWFFDEDTQIF